MTRQDQREVEDLWVVHVVGNKRPKLETYKYDMPGEENVGVDGAPGLRLPGRGDEEDR